MAIVAVPKAPAIPAPLVQFLCTSMSGQIHVPLREFSPFPQLLSTLSIVASTSDRRPDVRGMDPRG
jgi:hypothetical protein